MALQPFKVDRQGTVTHRESGTIIGNVHLTTNGWEAFGVSGDRINKPHWNGRKYAARVVWEASPLYVRPPTYQHQES